MITTSYGTNVRLVDDGFSKICMAGTDPSVTVRSKVKNFGGNFFLEFSQFFLHFN